MTINGLDTVASTPPRTKEQRNVNPVGMLPCVMLWLRGMKHLPHNGGRLTVVSEANKESLHGARRVINLNDLNDTKKVVYYEQVHQASHLAIQFIAIKGLY